MMIKYELIYIISPENFELLLIFSHELHQQRYKQAEDIVYDLYKWEN